MSRQLLFELLVAGTFLRQQFLLILAGRQLLLERLAAGAFLRQHLLLILARRQLLFEFLAAGAFLGQAARGPLGLFLCLETGTLGRYTSE